jgi:hypothetical protein
MLIHVYGEFWNPDAVSWGKKGPGNKGELNGVVQAKSGTKRTVDFWQARGIYGLYDNFQLIYVGQALDQPLGKRLRDHLTDRFAGRWDMFSWYSTSTLRVKTVRKPGSRQVEPGTVVNTLEALAIALTNPPLNRRHDSLPGARLVTQPKSAKPCTIRHYLESILKKL